jgi:23S rRNA (pseudouridine1915-N3)-methyltransferase
MKPYTIIVVSDSDKHFTSCITEYTKRLGKSCEIVTIKPYKNGTKENIIYHETLAIVYILQKYKGYKIACSREGIMIDTIQFHTILAHHHHCLFVIGWAYGYDEKLINSYIDIKIAFGSITLQHTMTKLILLEQLYRCSMITQSKSYHY